MTARIRTTSLIGMLLLSVSVPACGPSPYIVYARGLLDGSTPILTGSFHDLLVAQGKPTRLPLAGGATKWSDFQGIEDATCSYEGKEYVTVVHESKSNKNYMWHDQLVPLCTGDDFASSKYVLVVATGFILLTGEVYAQQIRIKTLDDHQISWMSDQIAKTNGIEIETKFVQEYSLPVVTHVKFGKDVVIDVEERYALTIVAGSSVVFFE